jgi:YihY family inner membrane protein
VEDQLFRLLPDQVVPALRAAIESAIADPAPVGVIGLALLLWSGSSFFTSIEFVLDLAYKVPMRPFITQRLVALATLFGFAALLVLASLASSVSVLSAVLMFGAFQVLYTALPNRPQRWQAVVPGALVASSLFALILQIFPLYVALFGQGFSVYLAFGTLLLFTLWLYLVGLVIVGGAELNAFLETRLS